MRTRRDEEQRTFVRIFYEYSNLSILAHANWRHSVENDNYDMPKRKGKIHEAKRKARKYSQDKKSKKKEETLNKKTVFTNLRKFI